MHPFFPEQSQAPVTSLPEPDNALPKWWKVTPTEIRVEWGGSAGWGGVGGVDSH